MSEIVEEEIVAKPFEITLPTNGGVSFILCGASRSGKTCLLKYLYKTYFQKHISVMFSLNTQADIYKSLSKKTIVSPEFLPDILSDCHTINVKSGNKFPFLMISDDFVGGQIKNAEEVTRLLTVYRNANMSSIFSFQGRTLINPTGRASCNYIAILAQQTPQAWLNVCKEYLDGYLPMSMCYPEKIRYCQEATRDHQFFFIDNILGEFYISKLSKAQMAEIC
jgi:ribosomal protein S19